MFLLQNIPNFIVIFSKIVSIIRMFSLQNTFENIIPHFVVIFSKILSIIWVFSLQNKLDMTPIKWKYKC